jgi:hypothetical protein
MENEVKEQGCCYSNLGPDHHLRARWLPRGRRHRRSLGSSQRQHKQRATSAMPASVASAQWSTTTLASPSQCSARTILQHGEKLLNVCILAILDHAVAPCGSGAAAVATAGSNMFPFCSVDEGFLYQCSLLRSSFHVPRRRRVAYRAGRRRQLGTRSRDVSPIGNTHPIPEIDHKDPSR